MINILIQYIICVLYMIIICNNFYKCEKIVDIGKIVKTNLSFICLALSSPDEGYLEKI